MTEGPRVIAVDDPEWCAGCGQKHSKCECGPDCRCATLRPGEDCPAHPFDPTQYRPAAPVVQGADELREAEYVVENGWLCEVAHEHTCGTGRDGHYGAHEPGCGLVPLVEVARLLAERDQAQAKVAAVEDLCDTAERMPAVFGGRLTVGQIRRALDGDT